MLYRIVVVQSDQSDLATKTEEAISTALEDMPELASSLEVTEAFLDDDALQVVAYLASKDGKNDRSVNDSLARGFKRRLNYLANRGL